MHIARSRGWQLGLLWIVLILALGVALRRAPLVTGTTPTGSGLAAQLGAPVWAFLPLLGVVLLAAGLTLRWWRGRAGDGERTPPTA